MVGPENMGAVSKVRQFGDRLLGIGAALREANWPAQGECFRDMARSPVATLDGKLVITFAEWRVYVVR